MTTSKLRPKKPDTVPYARWKAAASPVGVLVPDHGHVLDDFAQFTHPETRAAFADKWISLAATRLEQTWPVFYQLLKLVEREQLYARAEVLEGRQAFASFRAYWEAKTGKSFDEWLDLERTHEYVCTFRPELIEGLYVTAHKAALAAKNQEAEAENTQVRPAHRPVESNYTNEKSIITSFDDNQGTSRTYALRRLAKDRPDLHAQCLAGEMTPHAAMLQAGLRKRPPSRKKSLLQRIQQLWDRATPDERHAIQAWIATQSLIEDDLHA